MTDHREVRVVRRPGRTLSAEDGLAELLAAYHLRTEAEKGAAVTDVDGLPDRYRAEISDPRTAFADDVVLTALSGDTPVGCLVVTAPVDGWPEIKRLWTDPGFRGRGIASRLIGAALTHAAESGVSGVRLSVWTWRTGAVALYERLGFTVTDSWDERPQLLCMRREVSSGRADGNGDRDARPADRHGHTVG
ncbi:GNAT family N-acetyltransferase [Streptomyces arenae]|uniref:GNAT family N-acetyltransferase n=1 Tax=Streptomyces arenae TaxID=29301 RepID=UPI00265A01AF|nr:GNAT family N-acetyltransferase [Streptomyces arenae]MCG7205265.1 GNAT family N-acetyltransferase [Streptomyces arenae]